MLATEADLVLVLTSLGGRHGLAVHVSVQVDILQVKHRKITDCEDMYLYEFITLFISL